MQRPAQQPMSNALIGLLSSVIATSTLPLGPVSTQAQAQPSPQQPAIAAALPRPIDRSETCEVLIVGSGLAGAATAYESLLAGRTVCMTELTDWVGGQISSQGTAALDESKKQRQLLYYSRGYNELRRRIQKHYKKLNPGRCWVSATCFLPRDAHTLLQTQLKHAARKGKGTLKWFPSTVIKDLQLSADGRQIDSAIAIQHAPAPGTAPLNSEPLSHIIEDAYTYTDSQRLTKTVIQFVPQPSTTQGPADWYVVESTETGELIALADVPYQLGLDPRDYRNPSSPVTERDPYCTQGFTYTFAMEQTQDPQPQLKPSYYDQYAPYFSYEKDRGKDFPYFDFVFTYRRIANPKPSKTLNLFKIPVASPGDISMQNWTWGNDYRPGNANDNLILTRNQLMASGQLSPGGWLGGLRSETLRKGEENALAYYYWFVAGTTDSQIEGLEKKTYPNHRFLSGFDAPMGTAHGLSKHPYMREGRRIIGRPSFGYRQGFLVSEVDFSWSKFDSDFYRNLPGRQYLNLKRSRAGLNLLDDIVNDTPPDNIAARQRAQIYPDSVGIAQYAIDFHPCMTLSPAETPGNTERAGVRRAHGQAYPAQIPLRSMIPQKLDNLLIASKSLAMSHIAAAAYRVHSFEWSTGAAAGTTIDFALDHGVLPATLVDDLPRREPLLEKLQQRLQRNGNPTAFPNTSIFNQEWEEWRPW